MKLLLISAIAAPRHLIGTLIKIHRQIDTEYLLGIDGQENIAWNKVDINQSLRHQVLKTIYINGRRHITQRHVRFNRLRYMAIHTVMTNRACYNLVKYKEVC